MSLLLPLGLIVGFFVVLLVLKAVLKKEYCAICGAVTMSWIVLLVLNKAGIFSDTLIIGILIGQTSHGVYTIITSKKSSRRKAYALPILLALTMAAYYIITPPAAIAELLLVVSSIIILLAVVYLLTANDHHQNIKHILQQLSKCCKDW